MKRVREIRFRAWDHINMRMIYDFRVFKNNFKTEIGTYSYSLELFENNKIIACIKLRKKDEIMTKHLDKLKTMQYTGLKGFMSDKFNDSEEKEVYQGDYITIFHESFPAGYYSEEYITGAVDLDETGTAFVIKNAKFESNGENIPRNIGDMEISVSTPSKEDLEEVFLHYFDLTSDDITIHGNIYENPELLEVSK